MTIVSSTQDPEALTLTIVAELAAPPSRVWQVWSDPRPLERWWGPPTWPATFEQHDIVPGGGSRYYMTGPDGEKSRGWWRFLALDEPRSLEFEDGFADEFGRAEPADARDACSRRPRGIRLGYADDGDFAIRQHRADGATPPDGHGRGHDAGNAADRRSPRRGLSPRRRDAPAAWTATWRPAPREKA